MLKKLTAALLSAAILTACGREISTNPALDLQDNSVAISSVTRDFSSQIEQNDILIDDEYYRHFPDRVLSSGLNEIEQGNIPDYPVQNKNSTQVQSLSILNHKASIDIYDTYGTPGNILISGRVYEKKNITSPDTGDSKFKNLIRNIKYFTPDPISGINLSVNINGINNQAKTDKQGYFQVSFSNTNIKPGIAGVSAQLLSSKYKFDIPHEEVVIDSPESNRVTIITDIDDTIKYTDVNHKLKLIKNIFLGNYKTDDAIAGVSTLYNGILKGPQGTGFDCMHYVTGSPPNLFYRLDEFLKLNKFPQGSLSLKKVGLFGDKDPSEIMAYKLSKIRPIMKTYPNKRFVLFGDAIQKDPETYTQLKHEFPGRVAGIYIRNTKNETPDSPRYKEAMLTNSAADAAQDLFKKGIISQETLNQVLSETN